MYETIMGARYMKMEIGNMNVLKVGTAFNDIAMTSLGVFVLLLYINIYPVTVGCTSVLRRTRRGRGKIYLGTGY